MENELLQSICDQLKRIEQNSLLSAKEMLTLDDVVLITGFSKSYIYHLTHKKEIPHYKPKGGTIFVKKTELLEWMSTCKIESNERIEEIATAKIV